MSERKVECGECGAPMKLRYTNKFGGRWFYGCTKYPHCQAVHGCHQDTKEPLGVPANAETRKARMEAHAEFDRLWQWDAKAGRRMERKHAYMWLAAAMGLTRDECHIGNFTIEQCREVVRLVHEKIGAPKLTLGQPREGGLRGGLETSRSHG